MIKKIILSVIFILAVFLRFYKLGSLPSAYTPDEVAQGYTAYSILNTSKDEWGSSNLLSFRSFGDYKPPIQTLLMIPSVKFFGLTPFAVRFPNALLSVVTIIFFYLLLEKVFKKNLVSIIGSLFLSVSPWFLPMNRIALEANFILFFIVFGLYSFISFIGNKKTIYLILSSFFLSSTIFIYHSAKLFTPILFVILFLFYRKSFNFKKTSIFLAIFILFLGLNWYSNSQIKIKRTADIAIFNPTDNWKEVSDSRFESMVNGLPSSISRIFNNKLIYSLKISSSNYLSYFSPHFLVSNGAGETTYGMIPGIGVLGVIPTFGFIYGIYILIIKPKSNKNLWFLMVLLLISPIAASLAKGNYSGNRASLMIPFFISISAFGLVGFFENIKSQVFFKPVLILFSLIFIFCSCWFLEKYFFQGNQILSEGMLYGRREAMEYLQNLSKKPDVVIFSRKLSEPQSYALFFNKINPVIVQKESSDWLRYEKEKLLFLDQLGEYKVSNFVFRELNIFSDIKIKNALIIGKPDEFRDTDPTKVIYYPYAAKQSPAIYIYETSNEN